MIHDIILSLLSEKESNVIRELTVSEGLLQTCEFLVKIEFFDRISN